MGQYYLSKVISEGWVCYDEAVENGFDLDKSIKNIKKLYSKQVKHITANFNDKLNYKNGLETYSLLNLIQGIIFEQINFKDGHYEMYNENTTFAHWNTQAFFSKLFFIILPLLSASHLIFVENIPTKKTKTVKAIALFKSLIKFMISSFHSFNISLVIIISQIFFIMHKKLYFHSDFKI